MKRKISIVESAMRNRQIVLLLTTLLVLFGGYALYKMPRQEFPVVTIRQGLVIGIYPGANSLKVEEQLTDAVEKYLFGFKEVNKKKTYSISKDGMMIVFVELNDNVNNSDEFWSKLNDGLSVFKTQLPSGVLALIINSDFGDTSALLITMESDKLTYRQLENKLNLLESRLRKVESVSKIRHYGLQKEQISIYLESEKLTKYGINSSMLLANLFTQGFTTTSGSVESEKGLAPIHIADTYNSEEEIANQIIYADPAGNIIRLKDVARIVREYPEPDSYITNNGDKCLLISLEMRDGNNIVEYGKEVDKVLKEFQSEVPEVTINRVADQPKVVSESITAFLREFFFAIAAVILVTMLLLPFRVASVAATSIPITVFVSLGVMFLTGIELNTVTLAALIVVLGMIVDNSIVIVDSYMEKLDHGISRWNAAISSARGFFKAIFSATLAISITFFPFLFTLKGTFHDFVLLFPWTVTITLGISLLVAMLLIPYLEYFFIKKGFHQSQQEETRKRKSFLYTIQDFYEKWLEKAFRYPRVAIGLAIFSVLLSVVLFTQIPQRLMPIAERDQFAIEIYLPQGSNLNETSQVADSLELILKADKRVKSVTSFIGTSSPRFHTTYAPNLPAKNYAQFIVNTISNKATEEILDEYGPKYSNHFANAYLRFKQMDYQHSLAPVEVRFSGEDFGDLKIAADTLMIKMRKIQGISWVRSNFGEMLPGVHVEIDPVEASRLGISKSAVAANLAMHFDGLPVTTLWEDNYPMSVKLKTEQKEGVGMTETDKVYVHSIVPGVTVPLRQIAEVNPDFTQGQYVRRNGVRTLTVMADVDRNVNVNKVFPSVKKAAEECCLPNGVTVSYGGNYETDNETLPQILGGLIMSIFIIFLILLFHFRKISLALLVLLSSSLTLLGAAIGGIILDIDFGITSILGIVSLIGILVRNGIIMLDYAEELRIHKGMSAFDAAMEAGKRRMRPIFLTSAAASVGVIPMIISRSALWAPMGTVICFGTIISMVLLVIVMPVIYWLLYKDEDSKTSSNRLNDMNGKNLKPIALSVLLLVGSFQFIQAQSTYTLEQCKNLALENNAQLKNAKLELEASEQVKKAAFTKYFPQVNATGMMLRANNPMVEMDVPGGNLPVYDGNLAHIATATQFAYFPDMSISMLDKGGLGMLTAVEPVFAGGRIVNGNKLAKLGVEVNNSRVVLSKNDVLQSTEEVYWQVVSLNEKMKTLNTAVCLLDTIYKQANDAWKAGLISQNEVLKVMIKQSDLKVNKLQLENGIHLASMALCQFVGIAYDSTMVLADSVIVSSSPLSVYVDPQDALNNREEYKLLQQSVEAQELQTKIKAGEYMPELAVGVGGYYTNLMSNSVSNGLAFATIKIPISGIWEGTHAIKEQEIKEEIARNSRQNNTELLLLQIQKEWNELNESYQQIDVANETIKQAQENLKINRDNYNAGLVNISDMLEAQMLLQQAENRLTDSKVNYQVKLSSYLSKTGRYQ